MRWAGAWRSHTSSRGNARAFSTLAGHPDRSGPKSGPASTTHTPRSGSSLNRAASTHPATPPPRTSTS